MTLGVRLRELRRARGLTQAQLAGTELSDAFISQLETGKTGASVHTVRMLAQRLGVPTDSLMETREAQTDTLEATLLLGERALAAGKPKEALEIIEPVAERPGGVLRAKFQRLEGRALVALVDDRSDRAVVLLSAAERMFRAVGQTELEIRTRFDLARAHLRRGENDEAASLARECLRALERTEVVDRTLELQIHVHLITMHNVHGDFETADLFARRALKLAEELSDEPSLGELYASLASTRFNQGDSEAALVYAHKALAVYEGIERKHAIIGALNNLAWIATGRGQYVRAEDCLDRAEALAAEARAVYLPGVLAETRAELQLARGDVEGALRYAERALEVTPEDSPTRKCGALMVKARALASKGASTEEVRAVFDRAVELSAGAVRRQRALVHETYAQALKSRGEYAAALEQAEMATALYKGREV